MAVLAAVAWTGAEDSRVAAVAVTSAAVVAGLAAAREGALLARPRLTLLGVALAGVGLALVGVTPRGAITVLEAIVLGAGVGLVLPRRDGIELRLVGAGAAAALLEAALLVELAGRTGALRWAFALVVATAAVAMAGRALPREKAGRARVSLIGLVSVLAVGLLAWVGANDPTVEWFGHIATHGDRSRDQVALTFDDGPDARWSMNVAHILDEHGVKGTFFEVGKAIDARPDITKALYDDGQLLGNHSYHHDSTGWLDPGYPELARTQAAFEQAIGACPTLFRPPHGQRTPFMLARVADRGMRTVTWDASARDWAERDGHAVAQRILEQVRPGSIILLHDGLDGLVRADRSVLEVALPEILDGLDARGLRPVRLDELLDVEPYLPHC